MAGRGTDIILGEGVAELGGLYVIGTERNESRRVDNQLKGRSGRQGDPGSSEFFISLEDDLVLRFAPNELEKQLKKLKVDEDGRVLNDNILNFIDRTQRICEGAGYSIREYNIKLDDVLNLQRNTIYELRDRILEGRDLLPLVTSSLHSYIKNEIDEICNEESIPENWDLSLLVKNLAKALPAEGLEVITEMNEKVRIEAIVSDLTESYLAQLDQYSENPSFINALQRYLLSATDHHWLEHIDTMERLKEGIGMRSFSQEDPMRQYAREGYELFSDMYHQIEKDISKHTASLVKAAANQ